MNRPSFALSVLLASLAGSFLLVGSANSQTANVRWRSACYAVWPVDADLYGYDYGHCKYAAGLHGFGEPGSSLAGSASENPSPCRPEAPAPTVKPAEPATLDAEAPATAPVCGEVAADLAMYADEWSPPLAGPAEESPAEAAPPVALQCGGDEFDYTYATELLDELDQEVAQAIARCAQVLPSDFRTGYDAVYDAAVYGLAPRKELTTPTASKPSSTEVFWAEPEAAAAFVARVTRPVVDLLKDAFRVEEFTSLEAGCGLDTAESTGSYLSNYFYNFKQDFSGQGHAASLTPPVENAPAVDGPRVDLLKTLAGAAVEGSSVRSIYAALRLRLEGWQHKAQQTEAAYLAGRAIRHYRAFQEHVNQFFEPTQEVSVPAQNHDFGCWSEVR